MVFDFLQLAGKVSLPFIGSVDWFVAVGTGILVLVALLFLLKKLLKGSGSGAVPRRLQRKQGTEEFSNAPSSDVYKGKSDAVASQLRFQNRIQNPKELDELAGDVTDQSERDEKAKLALDELRAKLNPQAQSKSDEELQTQHAQESTERHHARWRDKKEGVPEQKTQVPLRSHGRNRPTTQAQSGQKGAAPSETQAQLEQLKKMEFKHLLK